MHDKNRALEPIEFIQMLKAVDDFYGQPFILLDWQHEVLWDVYGTVKKDGTRQYRYAYLEIPKKNGKALAVNTPIATINGWKTMGELKVGDYVFGDDGKPCRISFATDFMFGHKCYEITFGDGSKIIADEDHLWETTTYIPWLKTSVKTTKEIKKTLYYQNGHNHKIKIADPVNYDEKSLPIAPYVLGVWLGDGSSSNVSITCDKKDLEIADNIKDIGYPIKINSYKYRTGGFSITDSKRNRTKDCFKKDLRENNLLNNKHIPEQYLQSSIQQRTELLMGLMDTDGTISKAGQCSFTTTNVNLFEGITELINSLGFKNSYRLKKTICSGIKCKDAYEIQFWAYNNTPVFKLKRKLNRQKTKPTKKTRTSFRKIISIKEVKSVPVRCIQVDNASHLYLAGKSFIPTHNTSLIAAIALYHLICDGNGGQIYCCAADRGQAELVYKAACGMREQIDELKQELRLLDSKKEIRNVRTGTTLKVLSAEAYTKHGINPTVVIFDEIHCQPNRDLWDVMTFGAGAARKEPVWWVITTAGDDPDKKTIGWEVHEYARKVLEKEIMDPNWYVKIYNAPESADIFDEKVWHMANPSLGKTINIETVRQEALAARNSESAEKLFRWLRLNQWVGLKHLGWLPLSLWDNTVGTWKKSDLIGKKCYAGLDLSSTVDLTGLVLLFPPQQGLTTWAFISEGWVPEDNMKERVRRDGVAYDRWVNKEYLHATAGNVVDYTFIEARILQISKQYELMQIGVDQWNSRMLTQRLMNENIEAIEIPQTMLYLSPAMKEIEKMLKVGQLTHEENPAARWCFGNVAIATDGNENIKPMKNKSVDRIDLTVALIIAWALVIKLGINLDSVYNNRGIIAL